MKRLIIIPQVTYSEPYENFLKFFYQKHLQESSSVYLVFSGSELKRSTNPSPEKFKAFIENISKSYPMDDIYLNLRGDFAREYLAFLEANWRKFKNNEEYENALHDVITVMYLSEVEFEKAADFVSTVFAKVSDFHQKHFYLDCHKRSNWQDLLSKIFDNKADFSKTNDTWFYEIKRYNSLISSDETVLSRFFNGEKIHLPLTQYNRTILEDIMILFKKTPVRYINQ